MSPTQQKFAQLVNKGLELSTRLYGVTADFDTIKEIIMALSQQSSTLALISLENFRNIIKKEHKTNYNALLNVILEEVKKELTIK